MSKEGGSITLIAYRTLSPEEEAAVKEKLAAKQAAAAAKVQDKGKDEEAEDDEEEEDGDDDDEATGSDATSGFSDGDDDDDKDDKSKDGDDDDEDEEEGPGAPAAMSALSRALAKAKILGAVSLVDVPNKLSSSILEVVLLGVRTKYQGSGVGRRLMTTMRSRVEQSHYDTLLTHADHAARAFFERNRFLADKIINSRYEDLTDPWDNSVIMSSRLARPVPSIAGTKKQEMHTFISCLFFFFFLFYTFHVASA